MERFKKYLPALMFSCKKTSELIDKKEIVPLTFREIFILSYHNFICKTCHNYKKQSKIIDNLLSLQVNNQNKIVLSESKKSSIVKILNEIES